MGSPKAPTAIAMSSGVAFKTIPSSRNVGRSENQARRQRRPFDARRDSRSTRLRAPGQLPVCLRELPP